MSREGGRQTTIFGEAEDGWHQLLQENNFSKSLVSSDAFSVLLPGNCSIAFISGEYKGV